MPESVIELVDPPVQSLLRRKPVWCHPDAKVAEVLRTMRQQRIGSMVVADDARHPLGILTLRDVLDRIALEPALLEAGIASVMTSPPLTAPIESTAYGAALTMVRHGVSHLVLTRADQLEGVLSARDLFGLQSASLRQLSTDIRGARDRSTIEALGHEIRALARRMLAQGVATSPLCAFIASLNDLLTQRIVDMEFATVAGAYCWILMGSEGRSEQTLVTDQDNGLIFEPVPGVPLEDTRAALLETSQRVNQALARAGYALCPGNIMAGNPQWCLTLEEWRNRFSHWIDSGSPEALLHGSIFFDLRPLHGQLDLAVSLRQWLNQHVTHNPRFLHQMTVNALRNRPPLGWLRDFRRDKDGKMDLKLNGTMPFVDAARIYSLAHGIVETNTERRLAALAAPLKVASVEIDGWIAAYQHLQGLRLRTQSIALASGEAPDNRIDPSSLHDFDRSVLRLAFGQARRLQQRLAMDYRA